MTQYMTHYLSPLGGILLAADRTGLTGLWFDGQQHFPSFLSQMQETPNLPIFTQTCLWLDCYFSGRLPPVQPPLHPLGTVFQQSVWTLLLTIPYGQTTTYGELARRLAKQNGIAHISAQAVGGAVARNKISILIPCHRVIGADGSLTGYAGGIARKAALLQMESALFAANNEQSNSDGKWNG